MVTKKIPEWLFHLTVLDYITVNQKPVVLALYHPLKLKNVAGTRVCCLHRFQFILTCVVSSLKIHLWSKVQYFLIYWHVIPIIVQAPIPVYEQTRHFSQIRLLTEKNKLLELFVMGSWNWLQLSFSQFHVQFFAYHLKIQALLLFECF